MKRIFTTALVFSLFLLLAANVYAVGVADVDLGMVSRNESRSTTFKVTNNNNETITVSNMSFTNSNFQVTLDAGQLPKALNVNDTFDFKVTVIAPKNLDAVDSSLAEKLWEETGTIKYTTASNPVEASINNKIKLKVENKLDVSDWDVTIESQDGSTRTFGKKTSINNIRPGDSLKIEVKVENNFPTSGPNELNFDDVLVELALTGSNSGDFDFDENDETLSIDAGDEDKATFTIDIDDDAEEGRPTLRIKASGRDENNAFHGELVQISLEVEREDHDLQFREARLTPSTVKCASGAKTVQVDTQVLNIGRRDENNAGVELSVPGLNVFERKTNKDLDEDDDVSFTFTFQVPEATKAGVYEVRLTSVYDTTVKNNQKTLTLVVEECKKEEVPATTKTPEQPKTEEKKEQTPTVVIPTTTAQTPQVRVRETSFLDSNAYLVLLAVGSTLVLLVLVVLLVTLFKRK